MIGPPQLAFPLTLQPLAWLAVLVALYFSSSRRTSRLKRGGFSPARAEEPSLDHRIFGILALCKLLSGLTSAILLGYVIPIPLSAQTAGRLGLSLSLVFTSIIIVYSFAILAALIEDGLEPLPNLIRPAVTLLRWTSGLVLTVVLLADLPLIRLHQVAAWLVEAKISCTICAFAFEAGLLLLLCANLRRLGLCLRSRSVGLALGLTAVGASELLRAVAAALPSTLQTTAMTCAESVALFSIAIWAFYMVVPQPARLAHALNPISVLRSWHELAPQLNAKLRPAEKPLFIAGIESRVEAVLLKYGVRGTLS